MRYSVDYPEAEIEGLRSLLRELQEERRKLEQQVALLHKIVGVTALPPPLPHHSSPDVKTAA